MGLFDLVKQQHAVGVLADGFRQEPALIEAHIARRRTDEPGNGMPLHVLRHIKAEQLDPKDMGQLATDLRLADPRGAREEEGADGLALLLEPGPGQLDGRGQGIDGFILPEDGHAQLLIEIAQGLLVAAIDLLGGNASDLRHHLLHVGSPNGLLLLRGGEELLRRARLVNDVNGFIGKEAVRDIARGKLRSSSQGLIGVAKLVVILEAGFQPLQDLDGVLDVRLHHVDFLEASG